MADQGVRRKPNSEIEALEARIAELEAKKPAFSVYLSANFPAASTEIIWDEIEWTRGGLNFDTNTGSFVVPTSGLWEFTMVLTSPGTQTVPFVSVYVNGVRSRDLFEANDFVVNTELHSTVLMELTAGQTITIFRSGSFTVEGGNAEFYSKWQGRLVEAD